MRARAIVVCVACASAPGCKKEPRPPPGPAVEWHAEVGEPFDLAALPGGTLVVAEKKGITAYRQGAQAWSKALDEEPRGWLVAMDGCVAAGDDGGGITCLAVEDGSAVWKVKLPGLDADSDAPYGLAAARHEGTLIVIASDDRFLKVDPAECRREGAACVVPSGGLRDTDWPIELHIMRDGTRVTVMSNWLALHDTQGQRISALAAKEVVGTPAFGEDGGIAVAYDGVLARIRPERCRVADDEQIALDDRTEGRVAPPAGCVERLAKGEDVEFETPVVLGGDVAFVMDRELRRRGRTKWTSSVDAAGSPFMDVERGAIYIPCWKDTDSLLVQIVDLCAVAADSGRTAWRSPLGLPKAGLLGAPILLDGGDWLFVHLRDQVAALRKPSR